MEAMKDTRRETTHTSAAPVMTRPPLADARALETPRLCTCDAVTAVVTRSKSNTGVHDPSVSTAGPAPREPEMFFHIVTVPVVDFTGRFGS